MHNFGVIFCSCGIRINTELDSISVRSLKFNLAESFQSHAKVCNGDPLFEVEGVGESQFICMKCQKCNNVEIV